ncbi:hypothetical protein J3E68DRAFT_401206 [Trichoderma sp. SZMC 28012]
MADVAFAFPPTHSPLTCLQPHYLCVCVLLLFYSTAVSIPIPFGVRDQHQTGYCYYYSQSSPHLILALNHKK